MIKPLWKFIIIIIEQFLENYPNPFIRQLHQQGNNPIGNIPKRYQIVSFELKAVSILEMWNGF